LVADGALLIQPMANQAQSASARSKPHLVEKVAGKKLFIVHMFLSVILTFTLLIKKDDGYFLSVT